VSVRRSREARCPNSSRTEAMRQRGKAWDIDHLWFIIMMTNRWPDADRRTCSPVGRPDRLSGQSFISVTGHRVGRVPRLHREPPAGLFVQLRFSRGWHCHVMPSVDLSLRSSSRLVDEPLCWDYAYMLSTVKPSRLLICRCRAV
jgi:hypothetical protein